LLPFSAELLSFTFQSINAKIEVERTIILPVVLYGCETRSLTLKDGSRLIVYQNRMLRRTFGPKRDKVKVSGEYYIMKSFMIASQGLCSMEYVSKSLNIPAMHTVVDVVSLIFTSAINGG